MSEFIDKIKDYLLQDDLVNRYGFTPEIKVGFLAQGEYNKNYYIRQDDKAYVFRINMASQLALENQIEYEFHAIKRLEKSGVTPKVYFFDDSRTFFDQGVLMMEFLEGRPLNYATDLTKAAEIFAKIHRMDTCDFEDKLIEEKDLCSARIKEADMWLKEYRSSDRPDDTSKKILEALYDYCCRISDNTDQYFNENIWQAVNNTEVNNHNFIMSDEVSYLIDWEKPVISDPVQDITQFLAPTTTLWKTTEVLTEEQLDAFYSTYEALVGRSIRERVKRYEPFLFLRAFSWCAGAWMTYTNKSRVIQNQETFKVIEKYLSPDFMRDVLKEYI